MEKRVEVNWLYDFYAPLLTEHRREILRMYCEEDMSLGEIASVAGITRQGAYDAVKLASKKLEGYEEKLGMLKRYRGIREQIANCKRLLQSAKENPTDNAVIDEAIKALENIERIER